MKYIKELMLGKISKDDFLKKNRIRHMETLVKKGLLAANKKENAEKAEKFINLIFVYDLYCFEYVEILNYMLMADWHYQHENIAMILQKLKSPSSVDYLYREVLIQRGYLDYDDNKSKIVKCLRALGDIGTDDALEKIKLLAENDNVIIRQTALKQLAMQLFENDTGYKKVCIWKDEMPFCCAKLNKRQLHKSSGGVCWHEGIICMEASLRPGHISNYAMVCMNYIEDNSDGVDIIINKGEEACTFASNVLPFDKKINQGLNDEFASAIEEFFIDVSPERLPHGTIEILGGGYDEMGSSNVSFKEVMELLFFVYENIDNMSTQTLQTEIKKQMNLTER